MIVRWLGAFRKNSSSLHSAMEWELSQDEREVAAEVIKTKSHIKHARVGLLLKNTSLIKKFDGDVWSEVQGEKLVRTRKGNTAPSDHLEAFCSPQFVGIVIKDIDKIRASHIKTIWWFAQKFNLPVFRLKGAKVERITNRG